MRSVYEPSLQGADFFDVKGVFTLNSFFHVVIILFALSKKMGQPEDGQAVPSFFFPLSTPHFLLTIFYNFANLDTTFAAVAGRSITAP